MKNLGEKIEIGAHVRADDGTKLEPEEQPVTRTIATAADVSLGDGPTGGAATGAAMRTSLVAETTAGELAATLTRPCRLCAHWRPDEWTAARRALEAAPEGRALLSKVRGEMILDGHGGSHGEFDHSDLEDNLRIFGVCKILTDLLGDYMVTFPTACCPEGYAHLFKPRDGESRRLSSKARDEVMAHAQGRTK